MQPLIDNRSIVASKVYSIRACNTSAQGATSPDIGVLFDNVGNIIQRLEAQHQEMLGRLSQLDSEMAKKLGRYCPPVRETS